MYHKIEELAYNGDVQAIWLMLKDIVNNTWDVQPKTVHMTDPDTGENLIGSSFEALTSVGVCAFSISANSPR